MPCWRLSGFYFFYFATLGVLVPYWNLYLQSAGFTPVDVGNLIAILMFSRIVAPSSLPMSSTRRTCTGTGGADTVIRVCPE